MTIDPGFLAQVSLLAQLDDDERGVLAQAMQERPVKAGDTLFRTGDAADCMYVVQSAKVEIYVKDKAGQKILLHVAQAADVFGELSLLDGRGRTATAQVIADGTVLLIDREDLQQLFRTRPDAALDMLAAMAAMTRKANALLQERVSRNVNEEVEVDRGGVVLGVADWVANFSGSITFLVVHVILFTIWITLNLTGFEFDPYPFGLLTMAVSLEAIILSTLLLFSSNRQTARDRIRSDIEYEVNLKAELEVAHLHEKTDRLYEEMQERFSRLEKLIAPNVRNSGKQPVVAPRDGG